ncbi:hypothetical protein ABZ543_17640 [Streptomyces roseifaciens]
MAIFLVDFLAVLAADRHDDAVPGQRKRKQKQQERRERAGAAARAAEEQGHWEVVLTTESQEECRARARSLCDDGTVTHGSNLRVDMLCGRLVQPTVYRLSMFVEHASPRLPPPRLAPSRES